jgi:hypothetical protein
MGFNSGLKGLIYDLTERVGDSLPVTGGINFFLCKS